MSITSTEYEYYERSLRVKKGNIFLLFGLIMVWVSGGWTADMRNIRTGSVIPDESYADQPYVVILDDGSWLCTITTGPGHEGQSGQHIVATISEDQGKTWSELIPIEPLTELEASWAQPIKVPGGRVYVFYTFNGDTIRTLPGSDKRVRTDMLGHYVFKYSDDGGRTWSKKRYRIPIRETAADRNNDWGGKVQILWGIDKPIIAQNSVMVGFTKIGKWLVTQTEGFFVRSDNMLTEPDPEKIKFVTLPEGDVGLKSPIGGPIAEENNIVPMNNGSIYCVYRTVDGYIGHAYSQDLGHTWTKDAHGRYSPNGRKIKNPRACPKLGKFSNGKYVLWYHNHSGKSFQERNPGWITGGVEINGKIYWSEPEILLYDSDPTIRISYPDFVEQDGNYWITETQKSIARVHKIDNSLLQGLWNQRNLKKVAQDGLVRYLHDEIITLGKKIDLPELGKFGNENGFSIGCWLKFDDLSAGQILLDSRDKNGKGLYLETTENQTVRIILNDGNAGCSWECDRGILKPGVLHHIVITVDGGPRIITFVVDGKLNDGGKYAQYGWHRFSDQLGDVDNEEGKLVIGPEFNGQIKSLRIYNRYLRTSEAVGNYQAGLVVK